MVERTNDSQIAGSPLLSPTKTCEHPSCTDKCEQPSPQKANSPAPKSNGSFFSTPKRGSEASASLKPLKRIFTALQVSIQERVVKEGVTYYTIKVCKSYDETQVNTINRRYNDFFMLNNALAASGFTSLPSLPPKTLFGPSLNDLNVRQGGLEGYCRGLIERKDLRNSRQVKAFLDLEQFCPEIIYQTPQLLGIVSQKKNRYTTHCEFIARQNIFVTAQFDRTAR